MIYRCLPCVGKVNSGQMKKVTGEWRLVTLKGKGDYHWLQLISRVSMKSLDGGMFYRAKTACGKDLIEEVLE